MQIYSETPSKLAHQALGVSAIQGPIQHSEDPCNLCGYEAGDGAHKYKASAKFNNHSDTHGTSVICKHCKAVITGSQFILQNKCAVYSNEGVISLNKDIDLSVFIYHPPKPPFLAVYGMIKQQHLVWRTPVANNIDLFPFRMGDFLFVVDRDAVFDLVESYKIAMLSLNDYRQSLNAKKVSKIPSLFAVPTSAIRNMSDSRAFEINSVSKSLMAQARIEVEENEDATFPKIFLERMENAINKIHQLNYAEVFLALACTKNGAEEVQEHAKTRIIKRNV
jgi:CRISPR type IV-associated protein Csf1